ncbi:MAG: S41 family peptidase [Huintestinicola sp.]
MNKKISIGITIGLMAITAAVTFIITSNFSLKMFNEKVRNVSEKQEFYSKLSEIDTYVRSNCVDEIDEDMLIENMVSGYIEGLGDSFAEYMTAEESSRRSTEDTGISVGLGFNFEKEPSGYILITEVEEGTSAEEAGLMPGDIITAVNNTDVIAYEGGYTEAVSLFKCDEGTKIKLYIKRTLDDNTTDFITYQVIAQKNEKKTVSYRAIDKCGYIRIHSFNDRTESQFKAAYDSLSADGAASLIIDLRNNTGGSMSSLQNTLDHILPGGDIVTAEYKNGKTAAVITCTDTESISIPIVVLVNQNTSASAELFAFALRDYAGAQCVGKTTAGHGYLQENYKCSDGSVVRLSVAVLSTKTSGNFNGTGLKPDFDVSISSDLDIDRMSEQAAILSDSQLIKAVEIAAQSVTE